jgi:hypothetical protein
VTRFVGLSFGVVSDRLCVIAASTGERVVSMRGLATGEAVAALWAIKNRSERSDGKGAKVAYVTFDASVDFELLLRDLSKQDKDLLFGLWRVKEETARETPLYEGPQPPGGDVVEIEVRSQKSEVSQTFCLSMLPGKIFRLGPKDRPMRIYDIQSYFEGLNLREACEVFLADETRKLVEKNLLPLWQKGLAGELADARTQDARFTARLAARVEKTVEPLGLHPRQWYGPSALASGCLAKWRARKQFIRLDNHNSVPQMLKAVDCAYFGGRVESIKLGTIADVRTFDLNSAYAYATTLLSQFYAPLRFTSEYDSECPFSCWLVKYNLPDDATLGALPTRSPYGGISFRKTGLGYFWFPEVDYMLGRYPGCCTVRHGYVASEYKPVKFAADIQSMYQFRNELKAIGDPGERIVKLALSNLYGKFAQNAGRAHYQCRAWAGWITSLVRRLLVEAVRGLESSVICFAQDAIHLAGIDCPVSLGNGLGQWKRAQFQRGLYVAPGIYDLSGEVDSSRQASRGASLQLDFARIASDLSERQVAELSRCFFVGWALARQKPLEYERNYLQEVSESLRIIPTNLRARNYQSRFDWLTEWRDSRISKAFDGRVSCRYRPQENHLPALRLRLKDRGWV